MQPLGENSVNTPAFLGKLWKMVNDPATDHLICWSHTGTSFIIQNQAQFWYELLPLYYKHNNMSSFVRQLNMYGFHKMSTVENGSLDNDKDEIQFMHPFFVKDHPDMLRNVKRKATPSKGPSTENNSRPDDLFKILTDVKQIRSRQSNVDGQLNAMKQENALLWREVAILRQKHLKQQKIVNKLIQFLMTLVQPTRMTVGVKRPYQLMLNENPKKNSKSSNADKGHIPEGPTIHELDNELDLPSNIYDDEPIISSPPVASKSATTSLPMEQFTEDPPPDDPEGNYEPSLDEDDLVENAILESDDASSSISTSNLNKDDDEQKIFLSPSSRHTLLSNTVKDNNAVETANVDKTSATSSNENTKQSPTSVSNGTMTVATCDNNIRDMFKNMPSTSDLYSTDLTSHLDTTQTELDQFKDFLNGYNTLFDANTLLGLFNDNSPEYDLNIPNTDKEHNLVDSSDPSSSGSVLTPYSNNLDFTELFDDSIDGDIGTNLPTLEDSSTVNTPQITKDEPMFPTLSNK